MATHPDGCGYMWVNGQSSEMIQKGKCCMLNHLWINTQPHRRGKSQKSHERPVWSDFGSEPPVTVHCPMAILIWLNREVPMWQDTCHFLGSIIRRYSLTIWFLTHSITARLHIPSEMVSHQSEDECSELTTVLTVLYFVSPIFWQSTGTASSWWWASALHCRGMGGPIGIRCSSSSSQGLQSFRCQRVWFFLRTSKPI